MLLGGDEFGRTQRGNNNAYGQDGELSWLHWKQAASPEGQVLRNFVARLLALRRSYPVLHARHFKHGKEEPAPGIADISWFDQHGQPISVEAWNNPNERAIVLRRGQRASGGQVAALTLLLNPTGENLPFRLPVPHVPTRVLIDTVDPAAPERDLKSDQIEVAARTAVQLSASTRCRSDRAVLQAAPVRSDPHRPGPRPLPPVCARPARGGGRDRRKLPPSVIDDGGGWFEAQADCGAGTRYRYSLGSGEAVPCMRDSREFGRNAAANDGISDRGVPTSSCPDNVARAEA